MRIRIHVLDQTNKSIDLLDERGQIVSRVATSGDIFLLFYDLLVSRHINFKTLKSVDVLYSGSVYASTNVRAAFALANALAYSLGLQRIEELIYPSGPKEFYGASPTG